MMGLLLGSSKAYYWVFQMAHVWVLKKVYSLVHQWVHQRGFQWELQMVYPLVHHLAH
jgi:hypothetical protein